MSSQKWRKSFSGSKKYIVIFSDNNVHVINDFSVRFGGWLHYIFFFITAAVIAQLLNELDMVKYNDFCYFGIKLIEWIKQKIDKSASLNRFAADWSVNIFKYERIRFRIIIHHLDNDGHTFFKIDFFSIICQTICRTNSIFLCVFFNFF